MLHQITPLILTLNEAPNLDRVLQKLHWADDVVVVDSFSSDRTLEILSHYPQVRWVQRRFDSHAQQWNFGIEQVTTPWVLSLDADYVLSDELIEEMRHLTPSDDCQGYFVAFRYCVLGKPLRGTLLPPRQVLFRAHARYDDDGHTQLLRTEGTVQYLRSMIDHDDRKPLSRWLWAQDRYMKLEVTKLLNTPSPQLSQGDRLRKDTVLAPLAVLIYCLVLKGGLLDGWRGLFYAAQRVLAELLLLIYLIEARQAEEAQRERASEIFQETP